MSQTLMLPHEALLLAGLVVVKPEGSGPFPVVVQMHGCGGVTAMQRTYAEASCARGMAVVIVDSLTPRGIGDVAARLTVCTGMHLRGAERAADLGLVLDWLADQPWADPHRIAAAGWSHGAWAIMEALAAPQPHPRMTDLRIVSLFYPYAGVASRTRAHGWGRHQPPVFACLAGRDLTVGRIAPRRAIERLQTDGLDVELLHLPEATHAFDEDHDNLDPRITRRPDLTAQARGAYLAALARALASAA